MPYKLKSIFFSFVPVELVAIIVAFFIYSGICVPVNRTNFFTLLPFSSIHYIEGIIDSNPVKTSSGRYYSMQFKTVQTGSCYHKVHSDYTCTIPFSNINIQNCLSSESTGNILLLISSKQIEAFFPGKLFTEDTINNTHLLDSNLNSTNKDNIPIFETGAHLKINVDWLQPNLKNNSTHDRSIFANPYTSQVFIAREIEHCGWKSPLSSFRAKFRLAFRKILFLWGDAGGLLLALLSGTREYTNQRLSEAFKNAGLSHILALSGMHLSLFAGFAKIIGKFTGGKRFSSLFAPFIVIIFVWFAGFSPSLFRALLCTFIGILISFCFMNSRFSAILSLSFLLQLSIFPQDAFSPAFILSYGALTGIILGEKIFSAINERLFPSIIASGLTASEGAQLCTAPITASFFGSIMPIGIISSVIVSPIAAAFLILGLCCILIEMAVPVLMEPLGIVIKFIYCILEHIILFFAQFPHITL
jgi:competence protein ComEC